MQKRFITLLCTLAVCALGASAYSLTIVPTFDTSITSDPNAVAMEAAINAAISVFQTNYTDNLTAYVKYVSDPTVNLGQSDTWGNLYPYTEFVMALQTRATSVNDANALSHLTNSLVDPLLGGNTIYLTLAHARVLGLDTNIGPDGFDTTISLNMTLMNFNRSSINATNYDLQSVVEHEMDELLGTASSLPDVTNIAPMDLFRYDTNLNRSFTINGDNAYFSVDGTNLWARYNTDPTGDYGDWWSDNDIFWAPPGITPGPQVQDAFADPGTFQDLGTNEFAALDIIGYTLATAAVLPPPTRPTLAILSSGPGQVTVSWAASALGFSLEETADLNSGLWIPSLTGAANPAVIQVTDTQKFYRLGSQHVGIVVTARADAASQQMTAYQHKIHVMRPLKR